MAGTAADGSGGPLRRTGEVCNLLRTGWGPRGDSGSARGRVRATQPASSLRFALIQYLVSFEYEISRCAHR